VAKETAKKQEKGAHLVAWVAAGGVQVGVGHRIARENRPKRGRPRVELEEGHAEPDHPSEEVASVERTSAERKKRGSCSNPYRRQQRAFRPKKGGEGNPSGHGREKRGERPFEK